MDNSAIYKVLKYFKNEKKLTSDCLLKHHFLRKSGYDALNARLSELKNLGYISAKCTGNVIEAWITPYGLNFLANHKLMLTLKNRERFVTFILGIISGFILAYIFPFIFSFLL